ncbi:hypothetical protein [Kocuria sabuli]|uniref:hypothetical protein n=1 Tax=Kocuria sabuli TaxID=3071448 RepID=UPI0034D5A648
MTRRDNFLDRAAQRIMDLDSPAYGDERERAVFMEASSFGLTTGLFIGLLGALVASVFGLLLLPVVLLVLTVLPSAAALWYAGRRGVKLQELAENAGSRSTTVNTVVIGAAMVLTFAAMTYTVLTGHPVLPAPSLEATPGEGLLGGMAQGALIGGMLGGLALIIGSVRDFRRTSRHHRRFRD